jgi:hypothetical protein
VAAGLEVVTEVELVALEEETGLRREGVMADWEGLAVRVGTVAGPSRRQRGPTAHKRSGSMSSFHRDCCTVS